MAATVVPLAAEATKVTELETRVDELWGPFLRLRLFHQTEQEPFL